MVYNINEQETLGQEKAKKKLDLRSDTHSFDTDIAKEFGIDIALMYKHMTYWVNYNKTRKSNFHEGLYWFYNTLEDISTHFSYWSKDQVKRILKKMLDKKIILKGNFNKTSFDRTVWYTINSKREIHPQKARNVSCQMHMAESPYGRDGIATPIPNTNTNTKSISKDIPKKAASASDDAMFLFDLFEKEVNRIRKEKDLKEIDVSKTKAQIKAFDDLLKTNSKEGIAKVINETFKNDWWKDKMGTPLFFKKHFIDLEIQSVDSKQASIENNRKIAQIFYERFKQKALNKNTRIEINASQIEFIHTSSQAQPFIIGYNTKNFKDQINNIQRKINLY